jgi:endonuclease/exonuclease/phosphatase (EEP) superfamily protein YafD
METVFLCWNLNHRPLKQLVVDLARSRNVDVLVLLECAIGIADLLLALNGGAKPIFHYAPNPAGSWGTIKIFTRFPTEFLRPVQDARRFTIRHLVLPARAAVILAVVHFRSKLRWSDTSQYFECTELGRTIAEAERQVGHSQTVLAGDLNMNPFEAGVVAANGLNATMVRGQALKQSRTVQDKEYTFFYNPMWGHFGDGELKPPGTYHNVSDEHVTYYWNIFDQVLIRPSLVERLSRDGVEIVTDAAGTSLLARNGRPDKSVGSDHLPLLFRLDL